MPNARRKAELDAVRGSSRSNEGWKGRKDALNARGHGASSRHPRCRWDAGRLQFLRLTCANRLHVAIPDPPCSFRSGRVFDEIRLFFARGPAADREPSHPRPPISSGWTLRRRRHPISTAVDERDRGQGPHPARGARRAQSSPFRALERVRQRKRARNWEPSCSSSSTPGGVDGRDLLARERSTRAVPRIAPHEIYDRSDRPTM